MKNFIIILLLSFSYVLLGQKKVKFTYKVDYLIVDKNSYNEKFDSIFITSFFTKKGDIAVLNMNKDRSNSSTLLYKGKPYEVETSLNQIKFKKPNRYYNFSAIVFNDFITDVKRLDKTETVNGIKCNYYRAKGKGKFFEVCMAEGHKLNSLSFFENSLKDKGLLLKLFPPDQEEALTYFSHENVNVEVILDIEKEVEKYNKELALMDEQEKKYKENYTNELEINGDDEIVIEEVEEYDEVVEVQTEEEILAFYEKQVVWAKEELEAAKASLKQVQQNLNEYKESIETQKSNKE